MHFRQEPRGAQTALEMQSNDSPLPIIKRPPLPIRSHPVLAVGGIRRGAGLGSVRAIMKKLLTLALLALLGACDSSKPPARIEIAGAVAADQPASQAIGESILADGGTAVDAAVATALALGVENPSSSGMGGGGFAVIWIAAEQRAYALDFRERAPAGADASHYAKPDGTTDPEKSVTGCNAVGVPGEVAGLAAMHSRFGKLSWERVVVPAQRLAADGWQMTPYLSRALEHDRERIAKSPDLAAVLTPGGAVAEGTTLHDPELANTLGLIARHGKKAFYEGEVAAAIEAACRDVEGAVRASDLAAYTVVWRQPIVEAFRGYEVIGMPPPASGGPVIAQALNILEPMPFDRRGADAARSYHLLAEAMKHGFSDRASSIGDPGFVKVPLSRLVSKAYATDLRRGIDAGRTKPTWAYGTPGTTVRDDRGTTHVSIVDAQGNAVALTSSVNGYFGSTVRAPRVGILLNNTMDDFSIGEGSNLYGLVASEKNRIAPGKRPLSSMSPTIVLENGRVRLVAGASGGPKIISATLQTLLGVLVEGRSAADAVDAPRVHHQWMPDRLVMETEVFGAVKEPITEDTARELESRGHTLAPAPFLAAVNAVEVKGTRAIAAPDPRKRTPPPAQD